MQSFLCRKRELHHIGSRTVKTAFQQGPLSCQEATAGRYLVNLKLSSLGKHLRKDVDIKSGCSERTVLQKTAPRNETKNLLKPKTGKSLTASNLWVVYNETSAAHHLLYECFCRAQK